MVSKAPRVVGVDIARGLAVLGMFVAHAAPNPGDQELLADGRSSVLFATLAGVSLGLMTGGSTIDRVDRGARGALRRRIALRAGILFLLGVLLSALDSGIAIILDYYAIMFVLLLPVLFLPRLALAGTAAVVAVVMPAVSGALGDEIPLSPDALFIGQYYLLTGYYPALIWVAYLIAGLICVRSDLTRLRTQVLMIGGGAALSLLGYGGAALLPGVAAAAHSDTTAEVLGAGGLAVAVIGLLLLITTPATGPARVIRAVLWPLGATGAMALTVYTLQIIVLGVVNAAENGRGAVEYASLPLVTGLIVGALLFASLWRRFLGRGPLERGLALLTRSGTRAGA